MTSEPVGNGDEVRFVASGAPGLTSVIERPGDPGFVIEAVGHFLVVEREAIDPDASWIDTWLTSGGVVLFADDVLGVAG
jgi:hypothetical protein